MPQISVIIPLESDDVTANLNMESILSQTSVDLEVIVVGNSIMGNLDPRIRLISESSEEIARRKNIGLNVVSGKYTIFLRKKLLDPQTLRSLLSIAEETNADFVEIQEVPWRSKKQGSVSIHDQKETFQHFFHDIQHENRHKAFNKLIRSDLLRMLRFSEGMAGEDIEFVYRLILRSKKTAVVRMACGIMRVEPHGLTRGDLIVAEQWNRVVQMCIRHTPQFIHDARLQRCCMCFHLINKMIRFGCSNDIDCAKINKELLSECRAYLWDLLLWKLPLRKKIQITAACSMFVLYAWGVKEYFKRRQGREERLKQHR